MFQYIERRVRAVRNRIRLVRASQPYSIFIGVFLALLAYELVMRSI